MTNKRIPVGPRVAHQGGVIGKPGAVTGNTRAALSLLLAVVGQTTGKRVAARAVARALEPGGAPETIEVRRIAVTDRRGTTSPASQAATFMLVCNGVDTMQATFDEACDTLSRMPLLDHARWTLVDLDTAPIVADGR